MPYLEQAKQAAEETRKVTPYDDALADALDAQEKITMLLGHMRDVLTSYSQTHGGADHLADLQIEAEDGFSDAFSDLIGNIEKRIESYNPAEEAEAARADRIIDEGKDVE